MVFFAHFMSRPDRYGNSLAAVSSQQQLNIGMQIA
jgi:hypothetical protein